MKLLQLYATFAISFLSYQAFSTPIQEYDAKLGTSFEETNWPQSKFNMVHESAGWGDAGDEGLLGYYYYKGGFVKQNYNEALYWFYKGAIDGDYLAQELLGHMYENGLGTTVDYTQAYRWYNVAASHAYNNDASILRANVAVKMSKDQIAEAQKLNGDRGPLTWVRDTWKQYWHQLPVE